MVGESVAHLCGRALTKRANLRVDLFLGWGGLVAAAMFPRDDRQVGAIEAVVTAGEVGRLAAGTRADDVTFDGHAAIMSVSLRSRYVSLRSRGSHSTIGSSLSPLFWSPP
jgi:hypothetical protein